MDRETALPTCYRHPDRETRLACSRCERPICVECMHTGSVGQKCPECAAPTGRSRVITARDLPREQRRADLARQQPVGLPAGVDRRVVRVFCQGVLVDLRGKETTWPALIADGYEFTQPMGAYLRSQHLNGLLVRSARCEGTNLASFTPDILSNPEDVCYITYRFNPKRRGAILVERTAGAAWMEI